MRGIAALALCAFLTAGCGLPAWQVARTSIQTARGALDVAEPLLPDEPDAIRALTTTRDVLGLGLSITRAWESQGERPWAWPGWVSQALEWAAEICQILKRADVDIPDEVALGIGALQLLLPIVSAMTGET